MYRVNVWGTPPWQIVSWHCTIDIITPSPRNTTRPIQLYVGYAQTWRDKFYWGKWVRSHQFTQSTWTVTASSCQNLDSWFLGLRILPALARLQGFQVAYTPISLGWVLLHRLIQDFVKGGGGSKCESQRAKKGLDILTPLLLGFFILWTARGLSVISVKKGGSGPPGPPPGSAYV